MLMLANDKFALSKLAMMLQRQEKIDSVGTLMASLPKALPVMSAHSCCLPEKNCKWQQDSVELFACACDDCLVV